MTSMAKSYSSKGSTSFSEIRIYKLIIHILNDYISYSKIKHIQRTYIISQVNVQVCFMSLRILLILLIFNNYNDHAYFADVY